MHTEKENKLLLFYCTKYFLGGENWSKSIRLLKNRRSSCYPSWNDASSNDGPPAHSEALNTRKEGAEGGRQQDSQYNWATD